MQLFTLIYPNTCTACGVEIIAGYAINADVANSGGALCAKCAGVANEREIINPDFVSLPPSDVMPNIPVVKKAKG